MSGGALQNHHIGGIRVMSEIDTEKVLEDPRFKSFFARRARYSWLMVAIMTVTFAIYVSLVAFAPDLIGTPIADGWTMSIGIPYGVAMLVFAFVLTGIYAYRTNAKFDPELHELLESLS